MPGDVQGAGVLDIGAGNANCAMLAAGLMNLTAAQQRWMAKFDQKMGNQKLFSIISQPFRIH